MSIKIPSIAAATVQIEATRANIVANYNKIVALHNRLGDVESAADIQKRLADYCKKFYARPTSNE